MFHHVVMVGFDQPLAQADRDFIVDRCMRIERGIAGVVAMRFVENVSDRSPEFTHAFVGQFVDEAGHDRYQADPLHEELSKKVATLRKRITVLDYHA